MAQNEFKVVLGADTSQLQAALNDAFKGVQNFAIKVNKIPTVAFSTQGIDNYTKSVRQLQADVGKLKFQNLSKELSAVNTAAIKTGKGLSTIKPGANNATQSLTNLSRIVQDAPFGFIGIANNIDPLIESFQRLKASTGSTGGALKALAGTLAGPAGIAVGIAAVSSLIVVATQKYGSLNNAINAAFEGTNALADANREIGGAFAEAQGKVAGEIATITSLLNIARDQTVGRKAQQEAIDKLNKEYDKYLPKLTTENINTKEVTDSINKMTASLVRQAKVRGLEALISKEAQKTAELMTGDLADQVTLWDALGAAARGAFGGVGSQAQKAMVTGQKNLNKELADSAIKTNKYTEALNAALLEDAKAGTLNFTEGLKGQDAVLIKLKAELEGMRRQMEVVNKLREAGRLPINRENDALQLQFNILDKLRQIDEREVQIKAKAVLEIDPELTGLQVDELWDEYRDRVKSVFKLTPVEVQPLITIGNVGYFEKLSEAIRKQAEAKQELGIDVPLTINIEGESNVTEVFDKLKGDVIGVDFKSAFNAMVEGFKKSANDAMSEVDLKALEMQKKFMALFQSLGGSSQAAIEDAMAAIERIPKIIGTGVADAFAGIAEGIGAALAKGENPITAAAESFMHVIGSVLQQVGKEIIIASKLVIVLKAALAKAFSNPAASLLAGIALVIAGAALKNIKFNIPQLAAGGITQGPTLAMIGEAGQEAVIPLNRMDEFMGGGELTGNLVFRGEDLHYAVRTYEKKRNKR